MNLLFTMTLCVTAFLGAGDGVVVSRRAETMGTVLWMEVCAETRAAGLAASEVALRSVEETNARLSTWTTETELARFLAREAGERVQLTPTLSAELDSVRRLTALMEGAFDPSIGALVQAYGLRTGGRVPSACEVAAARLVCGAELWQLEQGVAMRHSAGLLIEEGGFGKGAALDQALAALTGAGIQSAELNLGGQLAFLGNAPQLVPIADPLDRAAVLLEITVSGGSVATSANTEQAGHLLDPRSGLPARNFGSVTVWVRDGLAGGALMADALSTGLFVLGPESGVALVEELAGVEAVFIVRDGTTTEIRVTSGLAERTRSLQERPILRTASDTRRPMSRDAIYQRHTK